MRQLLFELMQVALGQRKTLSRVPSPEEWQGVLLLARKQSIAGIAYHGVELLSGKDQKPPRKILLTWFRLSEKVRQKNVILDVQMRGVMNCCLCCRKPVSGGAC